MAMARYRWAARTDVGMKREHNEDSFLLNEDLGLYVVCDGMGGHAGGETASRLAVQTVEKELISTRLRADDPFASTVGLEETPLAIALQEAIEGACSMVYRTSRTEPELQGMGTTCIALLLRGDVAVVGHVGGSRAYFVGQRAGSGRRLQVARGPRQRAGRGRQRHRHRSRAHRVGAARLLSHGTRP